MKKYIYIIPILILFGCSGTTKNKKVNTSSNSNGSVNQLQLNLSILIDLSDRIDTNKYPENPQHYQRDISNIKNISEYFIKDMEKRGTFMSKSKIRVIFSPKPNEPKINIFAEKLNIDLSIMDNKQKKDVYDRMIKLFSDNLTEIYNTALTQQKWIGSDIWRFFKNDVKDYCVESNPNYRNILIILTDGYIYHLDSKDQINNRFAYLLPDNITRFKLRNNPNWENEIKLQDFGLITKRYDLENLEILVLEISPSPSYINDEDILKAVLSKWFTEMKVKRFAIYNTDLPEYTKQRINDFLN